MKKNFILFLLVCLSVFGQDKTNNQAFQTPTSFNQFNPIFHFPPVNQDTTYVCWSFSTLSFIESEMHRLGKDAVKLSVMFPVYYGFIEKAKYFVKTKGESRFKAGDLFGTVFDVIKKYGIVPESIYTGKITNKVTYNHNNLYDELYAYMDKVKTDSIWNEEIVVQNVRIILNKYLGKPPKLITYKGNALTPIEFAKNIVQLDWDKYVKITSFKYTPFYKNCSLNVPDNWAKDSSYFNVPIDKFYSGFKNTIINNYSLAIDGDISEPGRVGKSDICFIPEFDIPSYAITQDAREYRFVEKLTTDDHLMHIVGYKKMNGKDWFLVKDSWRDAFSGKHKGYFFMSDDYVKLKILAYMTHIDAVVEIISNDQN